MKKPKRPLLGLDSYRLRYRLVVGLLVMVLGGVAFFEQGRVEHIRSAQLARIDQRGAASGLIADALARLNSLDSRLQRYLASPSETSAVSLVDVLKQLSMALGLLDEAHWLRQEPDKRRLSQALDRDFIRLDEAVTRLVEIRDDVAQWFPGMPLMQEKMVPHNLNFRVLLDALLMDLEDSLNDVDPQVLEQYRTAVHLRMMWSAMISELRLLVSNRFGVFASDIRAGIQARAKNVDLYSSEVDHYLKELRQQRRLDPEGGIPGLVDRLQREHRLWRLGYGQLLFTLTQPEWRKDLAFLHGQVDPVLTRMRQRLSALRLELDVESAQDITQLADIARRLSTSVELVALGGSLFLLLSYTIFSRGLLRPIATTTRALKQEALGLPHAALHGGSARETRDLVEAFAQMREQVHLRQSRLDHMAHHDALTGLPNRILFRDRLEHAISLAQRKGQMVGLMFLDLDRFKQINDSLGHHVGDGVLREVAERLCRVVRDADTVARLSGDEFAVLAEGLHGREELRALADKILQGMQPAFVMENTRLHVSTSIGIVISPLDDTDPGCLIRNADAAMYEAKRRGRSAYAFFSRDMTRRVRERLELENDLRRGLESGELRPWFQPIAPVAGGPWTGCEALLRWHHPRRGVLTPISFLDVLDEAGLMVEVTGLVLDEVQALQLGLAADDDFRIAINLSGRILHDVHFADELLQRIERGDLRPHQFAVEITEDTLIQDLDQVGRLLYELRERGVRVALDDFGTGQSSLNHLRFFPFDVVKVEREFVRDVPVDANDTELVGAIIDLAHAFGMQVVAEGVEIQEQLQFLADRGCDYQQGFLLGRAMPVKDLLAMRQAGLMGTPVRSSAQGGGRGA